jgi:hypothetical protein
MGFQPPSKERDYLVAPPSEPFCQTPQHARAFGGSASSKNRRYEVHGDGLTSSYRGRKEKADERIPVKLFVKRRSGRRLPQPWQHLGMGQTVPCAPVGVLR